MQNAATAMPRCHFSCELAAGVALEVKREPQRPIPYVEDCLQHLAGVPGVEGLTRVVVGRLAGHAEHGHGQTGDQSYIDNVGLEHFSEVSGEGGGHGRHRWWPGLLHT